MDEKYICSKCQKEFYDDYHYLDNGYICEACLDLYDKKLHELFGVRTKSCDKFSVSIDIGDFVGLLDLVKTDFNNSWLYISLKDLRERNETTNT